MEDNNFDLDEVFEVEDYFYFYKDVLTEERTNKEIEFIEKEMMLNKSMKILDLACGYGRHTTKLAEKGYKITGIDNNIEFLKLAKEDSQKKNLKIKYIHKDMRTINYKEKFDIVLLLFITFGYFSDEENLNILKNISNALNINGMLCFDIFNRDVFLKNLPPFMVIEKENNLMIDRCTFDSINGRYINKRIIIKDGVRKDKPFSIRIYNFNEINQMLKEAGLIIHKVLGNWNSGKFTSESNRINIIAKKITS